MKQTVKEQQLAKKYPVLADVPPEKRQYLVKKAVRHPVTLIFALFFALLVIPKYLDVALAYIGYDGTGDGSMMLLKLAGIALIPFAVLLLMLQKLVVPWSLKRVVEAEKNKKS